MSASPPRVATGGTAQTSRPAIEETRAKQTLTADWNAVGPPPIEGLYLRDVKNVVYQNGVLTELFRPEWFDCEFSVRHVVHVSLLPGRTTQWHRHHEQRDIVFPVRGTIRMGFYDARESSTTVGSGFVTNFNLVRPRYVYIPPGVWHSLKNIGPDEAVYVVINDVAFDYEKPDDWVLPAGADAIPVRLD
jgi:dTDP-4-dehydrorhamnose 3,5-epimerase